MEKRYDHSLSFPIEIINNDGTTRLYSFDQSVDIYRQRIATAHRRFKKEQRVEQELRHCKERIAQIRRSFYQQFGWETFVLGPSLISGEAKLENDERTMVPSEYSELSSELGGELTAFLRHTLGCGVFRPKATLEIYDRAPYSFVLKGAGEILLLYMVENDEVDAFRLRYSCTIQQHHEPEESRPLSLLSADLQSSAAHHELILVEHQTQDWTLFLCGTQNQASLVRSVQEPVQSTQRSLPAESSKEGAFPSRYILQRGADQIRQLNSEHGMHSGKSLNVEDHLLLLIQGQLYTEAFLILQRAIEDNPYHRPYYLYLFLLSEKLGRYGETELALRIGRAHAPQDTPLLLRLVATMLRTSEMHPFQSSPRVVELQELLNEIHTHERSSFQHQYLAALLLLLEHRYRELQNWLGSNRTSLSVHLGLCRSAELLFEHLRWRRRLLAFTVFTSLCFLTAALFYRFFVVGFILSIFLPIGVHLYFFYRLEGLLQQRAHWFTGPVDPKRKETIKLLPGHDLRQVLWEHVGRFEP